MVMKRGSRSLGKITGPPLRARALVRLDPLAALGLAALPGRRRPSRGLGVLRPGNCRLRVLAADARGLQGKQHLVGLRRWHLDEGERVVEVDVADILAAYPGLVGDRADQVGRPHPMALTHSQEEPCRRLAPA